MFPFEGDPIAMVDEITNKHSKVSSAMTKFLLWCILLVLCWPLALVALIAYPIIWLVLLPFRLLGVVVSGVLEVVWAIVTLPAHLLRKLTPKRV
jgi:hypothetical protein